MAELFDRDVLQHVANARILNVAGLYPLLQRRGKLASGAAELLKEKRAEPRVRLADLDGLDQLFAMEEHAFRSYARQRIVREDTRRRSGSRPRDTGRKYNADMQRGFLGLSLKGEPEKQGNRCCGRP